MSRRVSLPGADELFRPTKSPPDSAEPTREQSHEPAPARSQRVGKPAATVAGDVRPAGPVDLAQQPGAAPEPADAKGPSGRIRHDEKITVYVSTDELLDLEGTRLALRREHGLAVDRGRLVREAIHLALEDAAVNGADSALVRRLNAS